MDFRNRFWKQYAFIIVLVGSGLFVVMTLLAMLFYPGGTYSDFGTSGYSFFQNFFSELGLRYTHLGGNKIISLVLFIVALEMVGTCLILFFLAFPQFFRKNTSSRIVSGVGGILGMLSGMCFMGVAIPADINMGVHKAFVIWAFRLLPAAILCFLMVIIRDRDHPKGYAWELAFYFVILVAYMLLLELGPGIDTTSGVIIQATGQKVIVYASISTIMIQSGGALRRNQ